MIVDNNYRQLFHASQQQQQQQKYKKEIARDLFFDQNKHFGINICTCLDFCGFPELFEWRGKVNKVIMYRSTTGMRIKQQPCAVSHQRLL